VGQGDSILIETSDSKHILIDAGPESADTTVISYLHARSVTTLDALIATHPDADHIGGADEVLAAFQVLRVYHPGFVTNTIAYGNFIAAVNAEGCPVYTDAQLNPGDMLPLSSSVSFQVLAIDSNAPDSNSASIVLKMSYGTVDFIFEGDAPASVESQIIANLAFSLNIDILKVSHHGSSSATSDAWLTATSPAIGVISVGTNSYGHPAADTLARLSVHGVQIYRTDLNGSVVITTNGTTWTVT
jgi:beta-lactamase superfamily II metal-dependent hydrolase